RDDRLCLVPDHRPAKYTSHQNDRRATSACTVQVDMPAADIDPLTRLYVGQHPRVLGYGWSWFLLGKDYIADGKHKGSREGGPVSAKCEGGRWKPWNNVSPHVDLRPLLGWDCAS